MAFVLLNQALSLFLIELPYSQLHEEPLPLS